MAVTNQGQQIKLVKNAKYIISFLFLIFCGYILFSPSSPGFASTVETDGGDFAISTFPSSGFLMAPNIAPGDKVSADLTVKNDGKLEFSYDITAELDGSDTLLYDILNLEIKQGSAVLYTGKLKDLQGIAVGVLAAQAIDTLTFTAGFPAECGNEYQGKAAEVTFVLNAREHPPELEGSIVWDPPLEKPDIYVSRGRIMPIRFHIIQGDAFDTVKRGIDLVISGEGVNGEPVVYTFSAADSTLGWDGQLQKPHYEILLDTEQYPVMINTNYTAKVKYGEKILGQTNFIRGH